MCNLSPAGFSEPSGHRVVRGLGRQNGIGKRGGNGLSVFGKLWGAVVRGKEGFKKMFLFMVKEECSN